MQLQYYAIGVTTGVAFCGVVGHPQRHEYTGEFKLINTKKQYIVYISVEFK